VLNIIKQIKFLVMDVDGTLTDGKIYMGANGEAQKAFDIKDGYGIKEILPVYGIIPVIITARNSNILKHRCKELGVFELHQGVRNKIDELERILFEFSKNDNCTYSLKNVVYIGDDVLDIQCMKPIKESGGLTACPCNSVKEVLNNATFISTKKGGEGVVRELIDWLSSIKLDNGSNFEFIKNTSKAAYNFIVNFNPSANKDGNYDLGDGVYANVMSYITLDSNLTIYETHKKYIDIQFVIYGTEIMMMQPVEDIKDRIFTKYNAEKDVTLYDYNSGKVRILCPADSIVFYPNVAHRGGISVNCPTYIRKIVVKVPVDQ